MKARYQYRFYPTDQQRQSLAQLFGCVRVVWNDALSICKQFQKLPKNSDLQKLVITQAKKTAEREWLSDVSVTPLQQSVADLGVAYKNFFDSLKGRRKGSKVGSPKFKKKVGKQSARFTLNSFSIKGDEVYLAKIGNVKPIWSRSLPSAPSSVTVIKDAAGRYFLSFVVEVIQIQVLPTNPSIGIDLGLTHLAITSDGDKYSNPQHFAKHQRNLKRKQQKLSRKQKGSNSRQKARLKVAKVHAKISRCREDFLHKLSRKIVNENQVIAVENLGVKNMVRNHKLAKLISDCGWGMFGTMLKYKAEKEGKTYQEVDRFFPSSKTCHVCLNQVSSLPLDVRSWTCEHCQTTHDRDINAAVNIKNEALRILSLGTSDTASLRGCQSPEQTSVSSDAIPVDARSPHLLVEKCG